MKKAWIFYNLSNVNIYPDRQRGLRTSENLRSSSRTMSNTSSIHKFRAYTVLRLLIPGKPTNLSLHSVYIETSAVTDVTHIIKIADFITVLQTVKI